jgi:flagellar basal body rod protein FlgG
MNIAPLTGMEQAEGQLNQAASRIAALPAAAQGADVVDLSQEMVTLLQARNSFEANVKTLEVMDEMVHTTLNLVG